MKELTTNLEVLRVERPIVEFNYQAMKAELEKVIGDWKGFIIKEDDLAFTKDLLADLNKKKKAIDDLRKNTKKELSEPIALFESQCKELVGIIDGVYGEIKEQYDTFEERRREQKMQEVKELVKFARKDSGLPEKYQLQIEIKPEYLNKTYTIAKVGKDLEDVVARLKAEWLIEQQRLDQIKTLCELANAQYGLNIKLDPRNFEHLEIAQAKIAVDEAGQRAKEQQDEAIRQIEERAKREAEEKARREAEAEAQRIAEELAKQQIAEAEARAAQAEAERQQAEQEKASAMELVEEMAEQVSEFIPVESNESAKQSLLIRVYGTDAELEALFKYMDHIGMTYERF
ncbi:MAG: DUF1351 domain-containing protein [Peptostreptococcaceae bacterium]|nr:DUF1351 domain-containing protein [Peptostreptococcaceae bacterium]